jgi:hypothetical protein
VCWECKVNPVKKSGNGCSACGRKHRLATWRYQIREQIPAAFRDVTLESPWLVALVGSSVIADARQSTGAPRIAALGVPGSGKTSLVAAMLQASESAARNPRVLWVSAHQLAKARAIHPLGDGEAPLIVSALSCDVLVVDELGGEDTRYASAVAEVLYERHAEASPTWVTTGVGPKEIADRYGGGIARRVLEDAKVFRLAGRK